MSDLPQIDSMSVASQQPNAMVNDAGEVFYPDNDEDARLFAAEHGARYINEPPQNPTDPDAYREDWPTTQTARRRTP
ncbi:MAG TPA: hypothetical protein VI172_08165 [Candidatus Dormibacteraeota bacterium]|jgi:hypothetical protein